MENVNLKNETPTFGNTVLGEVKFCTGQRVRCIKADPMDEHVGIEDKNRWHIGDEFIIESVDEYPWGVFLNDGKGHDLNARRAVVI